MIANLLMKIIMPENINTPLKPSSFVWSKFKMSVNAAGSVSINIAPVSS